MNKSELITPEGALTAVFGSMAEAGIWITEKRKHIFKHYSIRNTLAGATHCVCLVVPDPPPETKLVLPPGAVVEPGYAAVDKVVLINEGDTCAPVFALVRKGSVLELGGGYGIVSEEDVLLRKNL